MLGSSFVGADVTWACQLLPAWPGSPLPSFPLLPQNQCCESDGHNFGDYSGKQQHHKTSGPCSVILGAYERKSGEVM